MKTNKKNQAKQLGQAGNPTGWIGKLLSSIMLRHNRTDNRWTISLLDLQTDDHVLEIGFGPGQAIKFVASKVPNGLVAGIDHSGLMVKEATKRNREFAEKGLVDLRQGDVSNISFSDTTFDKVFAINSIYFWPDPVQDLKEVNRVMKPNGLLAITVRDRKRDNYKPFTSEKISAMLEQSGFHDIKIIEGPDPNHAIFCVTGIK